MEHSISPYVVRCYDRAYKNDQHGVMHDKKKGVRYRKLDDLQGLDLFKDLLKKFLQENESSLAKVEDKKLMFQVKGLVVNDKARTIHGYLKKGHWGLSAEIEDATGTLPLYQMNDKQAPLVDYFFYFYVPQGRLEAICMFHSIGIGGIKSVFEDEFKSWYSNLLPGIKLQFHPLQYGEVYAEWKNAVAKKIRINKFTQLSDDRAQALNNVTDNTQELIVKVKETKLTLGDFFKKDSPAQKMVELFESDGSDVSAEMYLDGKRRTLKVGKSKSVQCDVVIDENDVSRQNGILNHSELTEFVDDLVDEIKQRIY